jgi:hypothetical protein
MALVLSILFMICGPFLALMAFMLIWDKIKIKYREHKRGE